jgi:hypothetical protein
VNSVDPVVKVLAGLDQPANPTVEFKDALLARILMELRPAPEPRRGRNKPWRVHLFRGVRWRHGHRRRLVVLAAVALVAVATASAFAVRAFVIDTGIVGLPPVGATPSTPESGVLEMYYWVHGGRVRDYARTRNWVYADGRLIRLGASRVDGRGLRGFIEQRLTREGVKLLRSEILSAGGFGHAQPPPGSTSLHPPLTIQIRKRDRLVPLRWASDLERLEARLIDPQLWLPASAWKQRKIRAYVPSRFQVCVAAVVVPDIDKPRQGRLVQMGPARIVALLPAAAQKVLRGRDWRRRALRLTPSARRGIYGGCFAVTTSEARSLAEALDGAEPATARKGGAINLNYKFDAPGPSRQVWISFDPFLPHGEEICSQCG